MKSLLFIPTLILTINAAGIERTATGNSGTGWGVATNWTPSGVPVDGDIVIIPLGHTLSIKNSFYNSLSNLQIEVRGTLHFDPSGKLLLGSNSLIVLTSTAQITRDIGSSSALISMDGVVKYNASIDGTITGPKYANNFTGISPNGFSEGALSNKIISFKAQNNNSKVTIQWKTGNEVNTKLFLIERSEDLISWKTVKTFNAKGVPSSYSWIDNEPKTGANYYRLKSTSHNNNFELSKVVKITFASLAEIRIGPNPVSNTLYVSIPLPSPSSYSVELFNSEGILVRKTAGSLSSGIIKLNLDNLFNGIYFVQLRQGKDVLMKKQIQIQK
jgi:hypothetical protein